MCPCAVLPTPTSAGEEYVVFTGEMVLQVVNITGNPPGFRGYFSNQDVELFWMITTKKKLEETVKN
jgi:hypothetical protein